MLVLPINFFRIYLYIFQCASLYLRLLHFSSLYNLVEVRRVELLTSCLQGRRSSQTELYPQFLAPVFTVQLILSQVFPALQFNVLFSTLKNKQ